MKRIKLFENFDSVNESEFVVDIYKMSATPDGEIKVTGTKNNKEYLYVVSAGVVGIKVKDFPNGNSISVSALGKTITSPLEKDGETVKAIKTNLGKSKIKFQLPQAALTLTCKSGCQKTGDVDVVSVKMSAEDLDINLDDILDMAKDAGHNVMKSVEGGVDKLKSFLKW
jgi:hypothetical protein